MPKQSMDTYINSQLRYWQQRKDFIENIEEKSIVPFITISREYGCGGYDIAAKIVELINAEKNEDPLWTAYDKELIQKVMDDMGLSQALVETLTTNGRSKMADVLETTFSKMPAQVTVYRKMVKVIRLLAFNGKVIIVGRGGNAITRDMENGYHVRIVAAEDWKVKNIMEKLSNSRKEAEKLVKTKQNDRERFIKEYVKFDLTDPENYDIVINNSRNTTEEAAKIIIAGMKIKGLL